MSTHGHATNGRESNIQFVETDYLEFDWTPEQDKTQMKLDGKSVKLVNVRGATKFKGKWYNITEVRKRVPPRSLRPRNSFANPSLLFRSCSTRRVRRLSTASNLLLKFDSSTRSGLALLFVHFPFTCSTERPTPHANVCMHADKHVYTHAPACP